MEHGSVRSGDRISLHYCVGGQGSPALCLIHCWGGHAGLWAAQLEHFARTHTVVALDLAGHGASGTGRARWTMQAFGEDVRAVVEHLDLRRVVLVGHSMGATVMLEAARLLRERILGLVAVDALRSLDPPSSREEFRRQFAALFENFQKGAREFVTGLFLPTADPALVDQIATGIAATLPETALAALEELRCYDKRQGLTGLDLPLWAINTDRWPTDRDRLRALVPQYEVEIVPGLGHFLPQEAPERFNCALESVLARL